MKKMKYNILMLALIFNFTMMFSLSSSNGANFIKSADQEYYPSTNLELELTNLTIGNNYAVLIGSNQAVIDQQWFNFTATSNNNQFSIIHFDKSSRYDINNTLLTRLVMIVYFNNVAQDTIYFAITDIEDQFNLLGYAGLLRAGIPLLFVIFLTYIITKYFLVKNI